MSTSDTSKSRSEESRSDKRVQVSIENGIAMVTLNRPEKYNGLDMPMFKAITEAARSLKKDRSVRAIILSGTG